MLSSHMSSGSSAAGGSPLINPVEWLSAAAQAHPALHHFNGAIVPHHALRSRRLPCAQVVRHVLLGCPYS